MKVKEIEEQIPEGLHDAKLIAIHRALVEGVVVLDLEVVDAFVREDASSRPHYRNARLCFRSVNVLAIDVPDANSRFLNQSHSDFVIIEDGEGVFGQDLLAELPAGSHTYAIFVQDWYGTIRIAAADVDFEWM